MVYALKQYVFIGNKCIYKVKVPPPLRTYTQNCVATGDHDSNKPKSKVPVGASTQVTAFLCNRFL